MRLIYCILFLGILFGPEMAIAQSDVVTGLKPPFFSLRNARVSVGIYGNLSTINDDGEAPFNFFQGTLPEGYTIQFDPARDYPTSSAGLMIDLFAPNSRSGFTFGVEYNRINFQINDASDIITDFELTRVSIPFYLKMRFGEMYSPTNFLLLLGGLYTLPVDYKRTVGSNLFEDTEEVQSGFSLSAITGVQFRFTGKDRIAEEITDNGLEMEFPRAWLFLRTDLMLNNLFDPDNPIPVLPGIGNEEIDYRDLNITIGLAVFLGFKAR